MRKASLKFKSLIEAANKQQSVKVINKVSMQIQFPLYTIDENDEDDKSTISLLSYKLYEALNREIYVIRFGHSPNCYLLNCVKFSTKNYVVALQKPVRYLTSVKSLEEVTL